MILNLHSDDVFLSLAISKIVSEIGNFKFIVTSTSEIPFKKKDSGKTIVHFIDCRVPINDIAPWLINITNYHVVLLSLSDIEKNAGSVGGKTLNISGPVKKVKEIFRNVLYALHHNEDITHQPSAITKLTRREKEIFTLLANGWSIYKIAEYSHSNLKTIYAHRLNIAKKKGVRRFYNLHKELTLNRLE